MLNYVKIPINALDKNDQMETKSVYIRLDHIGYITECRSNIKAYVTEIVFKDKTTSFSPMETEIVLELIDEAEKQATNYYSNDVLYVLEQINESIKLLD